MARIEPTRTLEIRESHLTVDAADFAAVKDSLIEQRREIGDDALETVAGGWFFK